MSETSPITGELSNSKIAAVYKHAYEPAFDATFIGYSPRGLPLRVHYFPGFKLQPPVRVAAPGADAVTVRALRSTASVTAVMNGANAWMSSRTGVDWPLLKSTWLSSHQ